MRSLFGVRMGILAGLFLAVLVIPAQSVELTYNFVAGSTAEYRVTVNAVQIIAREGEDLPETASFTQEYGITNTVLSELGDGKGRVETRFDKLAATIQAGGVTVQYDSVKDATPAPPFIPLAAMVGASYRTDLSPRGEVLGMSGFDEIQERILSADPSLALSVDYDTQGLLDSISNTGTVQLPAGEMVPGATWISSLVVPTPFSGSLIVSATFTYVENVQVAGFETARINFETAAKSLDEPQLTRSWSVGASEIETRHKLDLTGSGSINLAITEGMVVRMNWTGRMISTSLATMLVGPQPETLQTISDIQMTHSMDLTGHS